MSEGIVTHAEGFFRKSSKVGFAVAEVGASCYLCTSDRDKFEAGADGSMKPIGMFFGKKDADEFAKALKAITGGKWEAVAREPQ